VCQSFYSIDTRCKHKTAPNNVIMIVVKTDTFR